MAHYKLIADLEHANGDINAGFVANIELGGWVFGRIFDENGNELGHHLSSTLSYLEEDLLCCVPFDKENDTYEKNW